MRLSDILNGSPFEDGVMRTEIPESWGQGRTAYGGLTAAIATECAARSLDELPPLRSVQIAFIAPVAGEVRTEATMLRRGKSTSFVEVNLSTDRGLAARGSFVYGAARESTVRLTDLPMPDLPDPDELDLVEVTPQHPAFLHHYDITHAAGGRPFTGETDHFMQWWARSKDPSDWGTLLGLLAIGDLTPPAAAPKMTTFAPVSSVNWQIDLFGDDFSTDEGWYALHSYAQWAGDGWSAQDMAIWNKQGRPVAAGRQSVVIFS